MKRRRRRRKKYVIAADRCSQEKRWRSRMTAALFFCFCAAGYDADGDGGILFLPQEVFLRLFFV